MNGSAVRRIQQHRESHKRDGITWSTGGIFQAADIFGMTGDAGRDEYEIEKRAEDPAPPIFYEPNTVTCKLCNWQSP